MKINHSFKMLLIMAIGVVFVSACASLANDPLVGASWVAVQDIEYPPRRSEVSIQDGKIVERSNQRDRFAPHCAIVSSRSRNQALTIKEGSRFKIHRVSYPSSAVNVTTTIYETRMQVEATNYPEITEIRCSVWSSQGRRHMSTEAMQNTMKGLFALELSPNDLKE